MLSAVVVSLGVEVIGVVIVVVTVVVEVVVVIFCSPMAIYQGVGVTRLNSFSPKPRDVGLCF